MAADTFLSFGAAKVEIQIGTDQVIFKVFLKTFKICTFEFINALKRAIYHAN